MEVRKKTKKYLELKQRLEIIDRLNQGQSENDLAIVYDVSTKTIRRLKDSEDNVLEYANILKTQHGNTSTSKKKMTGIENSVLEKTLFAWFLQIRSLGQPVTGFILQEKALMLNQKVNGPENFKASSGWLQKFKKRHGIHSLSIQGEKLSADSESSGNFQTQFSKFLEENQYDLDNVYNADETGLYWKTLPNKTLASCTESTAPGRKVPKDRVTLMVCGNASGTHKMPLFLIGKSKKPRCFKNVVRLPVQYTGRKNAWMDRTVFIEWYTNIFLAKIQKRRTETARNEKVLLLLDNAPSHPSIDVLINLNSTCQVMYLPPNVTSLIQPMDQGVIEKTKRLYRKNLLHEILLQEDAKNVVNFMKNYTIKDCCYQIASAWDSITQSNLKNAGNKLLPVGQGINQEQYSDKNGHILSIVQRIPNHTDCTLEDVDSWLNEDRAEPGWHILTDDELLNSDRENPKSDDFLSDEELDSNVEECSTSSDAKALATEAIAGLTSFRNWFETRWESTTEDIRQINNYCTAALEILESLEH